jgi:hypothetical protein
MRWVVHDLAWLNSNVSLKEIRDCYIEIFIGMLIL